MPLVRQAIGAEATPSFITSPIATWATLTVTSPTRAHANNLNIGKRSSVPLTTEQTGLRREEVGGIIIGISVGLLLVILLFWCCFARRPSSGLSDTESEWSAPASPPPPPPPKPSSSLPPPPPKPGPIAPPSVATVPRSAYSASNREKLSRERPDQAQVISIPAFVYEATPSQKSVRPASKHEKIPRAEPDKIVSISASVYEATPPQKSAHPVPKHEKIPRSEPHKPKSIPIPAFAAPEYYKAKDKQIVVRGGMTYAKGDTGETVGWAKRKRGNDLDDEEINTL